ncbi:MAG: helix-turn-helix domain-containing protein [Alphaproteobacteria bacterium]|nr:helix-turn-helix domain-containing protein [Alphaproteobacteria bacterium]
MGKSSERLISVDRVLEILASSISIILGLFGIGQYYGSRSTIRPERIYSSTEAAAFLEMDRLDVLRLIKSGAIQAGKGGNGNYRIIGQSLINYLARSTASPID